MVARIGWPAESIVVVGNLLQRSSLTCSCLTWKRLLLHLVALSRHARDLSHCLRSSVNNMEVRDPVYVIQVPELNVGLWRVVPPMLMASIAMQESYCSPNVTGAGGEQGLMQLTADKCKHAPKGNCRDPVCPFLPPTRLGIVADTSILGIQYSHRDEILRVKLENAWRECICNGWWVQRLARGYDLCERELQISEESDSRCWYYKPRRRLLLLGTRHAAAVRIILISTSLCRAFLLRNSKQLTPDFMNSLQQLFNGWAQNVDPYNSHPRIGKYFNLDVCHHG